MSGDDPSIDELLSHRDFLERLARSLVTDPNDAEDLVQETWMRAMRRPPQPGESMRAWLARILRNVRISRWRSDSARRAREESRPAGPIDEIDPLERWEEAQRVTAAVSQLEPSLRRVILRRYHDGWTPTEIAERDGIPLDTVKTRLRRARAELKSRLSEGRGWNRARTQLGLLVGIGGLVAATDLSATEFGGTGTAVGSTTAATMGGVVMAKSLVIPGILLILAGWFLWPETKEPTPIADAPVGETIDETQDRSDDAARSFTDAPSTDQAATKLPVAPSDAATIVGRVVSLAGEPLADVAIEWRTAYFSEPTGTTVTDAEGAFELPARAGDLVARMRFDHAEYCVEETMPNRTLVAGVWDCGTIRLDPGVQITGRVIDRDSERPLPQIEVWRKEPRALDDGWSVGAITDRRGAFTLDRPVRAAEMQALAVFGESDYGHTRFEVPAELTSFDVVIRVGRAGDLEVRVIDEGGRPVPDRQIRLAPQFLPYQFPGSWNQLPPYDDVGPAALSGLTDRQGSIRFTGLPVEQVEDASPSSQYRVWLVAEPVQGRWAVVKQGSDVVEFQLRAPVEVEVFGAIVDRAGKPIVGATVRLDEHEVVTDGEGRYALPRHAIEQSRILVEVSAEGYVPIDRSAYSTDGGPFEIDFTLAAVRRVGGTILDEAGEPVAGLPFELTGDGQRLELTSGEDGSFEGSGLPGDLWEVSLRDDSAELVADTYLRPGVDDQLIVVRSTERPTTALRATVIHHETGEPLAVTRATLFPEVGVRGVLVERGNGWLAAEGLHPGTWSLKAQVDGLGTGELTFTVDGEELIEPVLQIGPAASLDLTIDPSAIPEGERPKRLFIVFNDSGCFWANEAGERMPGVTNNCALIPLEETNQATIVSIAPQREFRIQGVDGSIEETVVLDFGERRALTIALQPAGELLIRASTDFPPGVRRLWLRRDASSDWFRQDLWWSQATAEPGEPPTLRKPLPSGTWQWREEWIPATGPAAGVSEVREGSVTIPAGGEAAVDVR